MAKAKGGKVSEKEKRKMWELYQEYGCYAIVAKKMRRSRDTVSRHVKIYETALGVAQIMTDKK